MALIDNLEAYYPFDGDVLDVSGNGNHGTLGAATFGAGKVGQSVACASGSVLWPAFALTTFSVSLWVKTSSLPALGALIAQGAGAGTYQGLYIESGKFMWYSGVYNHSTTAITLNTWTHLVATYDGTTVRFYKDGGADGTAVVALMGGSWQPDQSMNVGGAGPLTPGILDELGVWSARVLSPSEVADLWNGGAGLAYPLSLVANPPVVNGITPATGPEAGGTAVVIDGTDFVTGATVTIGGEPALSVQVNSATEIVCDSPPGFAGARDVVVTNPDAQSDTLTGGFLYTAAAAVFTPWGSTIAKLLPPGRLWDLEPNSLLQRLTVAIGDEFARVQARALALIEETDPRTADETIADWERVLALPDEIVTAIPATLAARQVAVTSKYVARAGQNLAYFTTLCAACGYALVSITKYGGDGLARVADRIGTRLYGTAFAYSMLVTVTDTASPPALTHTQFEAVVRHHTHSHIQVMFTYV